MSAVPNKKYTVEEYIEMELTAHYKSEYYNGEIFPMGEIEGDTPEAMAGAMPAHNTISSNISFMLQEKLRGKGCKTYSGDQQLFIPETGLYTYPDISVYCGPLEHQNKMCLKNPLLLVEILSKTRQAYDRGGKFEMYRTISSLKEYLMIDSTRIHVELWRKENNTWLLATETNNISDSVELKSIGHGFPLQEFYYEAIELINNLSIQ